MLKLGLMLGALAFLWVSWASWSAGYPVEIASVRGLVAFMAVCTVGYVAELVVSTAPPASAAASKDGAASGASGAAQVAAPQQPAALPQGAAPEVPAPIVGAPAADQATAELEERAA